MTSWRSLARIASHPIGLSVHSMAPEAVREGVGGCDGPGREQRGTRIEQRGGAMTASSRTNTTCGEPSNSGSRTHVFRSVR